MKRLEVLVLIVLAFFSASCDHNQNAEDLGGKEITQQFLSDYSGIFQEEASNRKDSGERLSITSKGEIEALKIRQVGSEHNPAIPYPTVCSYTLKGQIRYVIELNETSRQRVNSAGDIFLSPETHNLVFSVHQVTLTDELHAETTSNSGCQIFQEQMNQDLPVYTYGMELFGKSKIRLHTSGGGDYEGGPRTDSTLDEVFVRQ